MKDVWLSILLVSIFSGGVKLQLVDDDAGGDGDGQRKERLTSCTKGWFPYGDRCYASGGKRGIGRVTWDEASKKCREYGGQLATVYSEDLDQFLHAFILMDVKANMWIGLHDKNEDYRFEWEDGTEYNYSNWGPLEPLGFNGDVKEDCVEMWFRTYGHKPTGLPGQWNDDSCSKLLDFICQHRSRRQARRINDPRFCPPRIGGWRHRTSCYHIVSMNLSWSEAEEYCIDKHQGHLVTIKDFTIDVFLDYILKNYTEDMWIGIKVKDDIQQQWSSGWFVVYTKWAKDNEELNEGTCVVRNADGEWIAVSCKQSMPFICETSTVNPPALKSPTDLSCPDEPRGWRDLGGEFCYYFELSTFVTWSKADFMCRRRGGTLASIHSQEEQVILHQFIIYKEVVYWIGLYRHMLHDEEFVWIDETPFDFTSAWAIGEPNSEKEQCVEVRTDTMGWNDMDCDYERGYICSVKKVTSNLTIIESQVMTEAGTCGFSINSLIGVFVCVLVVAVLLGVIVYYLRPNVSDKRKTSAESLSPLVHRIPKPQYRYPTQITVKDDTYENVG